MIAEGTILYPQCVTSDEMYYDDEPYAYWVVVEKNIRFFEVNILKTAEVDGDFTNKGYVKCYDSIDKFDDDEPTETIDVTFIF